MSIRVEIRARLAPEELERVAVLVERATEVDGARPFSEHVALHLRYGGDSAVRHVLAYDLNDSSALLGYAHLDPTDVVAGSSAELVVDPDHRRRGVGRRLVTEVLGLTPDGRLRLWAHGNHPGATALAEAYGMTRGRTLWQLRRSLFAPLPLPTVPTEVTVRTFRPGADDAEWVALNARAFADHPEQGSWGLGDLHQRMAEEWFDPSGFFLAERSISEASGSTTQLVGFHWTKVHGGDISHDHPHAHSHEQDFVVHGHAPIGEVYIVGVDSSERGNGLGRALTIIGLTHLRAAGLPEVMLYVDADNSAALRLYESLGFARWDQDVMFAT